MTSLDEVGEWAGALEQLVAGLGGRFYRAAGMCRALSYLRGLLAPLERKNGWHLAEAAGDVSPAAMQDFLTRTRWDADGVRDDLQDIFKIMWSNTWAMTKRCWCWMRPVSSRREPVRSA